MAGQLIAIKRELDLITHHTVNKEEIKTTSRYNVALNADPEKLLASSKALASIMAYAPQLEVVLTSQLVQGATAEEAGE